MKMKNFYFFSLPKKVTMTERSDPPKADKSSENCCKQLSEGTDVSRHRAFSMSLTRFTHYKAILYGFVSLIREMFVH